MTTQRVRRRGWQKRPDPLAVAGKGEIYASLEVPTLCDPAPHKLFPTADLTVTGGSGKYAGAVGSGTLEHAETAKGFDTWSGTLTVPGVEFDTTAPTISASNKTVTTRKRAVRVRYSVTATDNVDGAVPVTCKPPSGSRFKIGRTKITCSATDSSANTATARFTVTVKRRH